MRLIANEPKIAERLEVGSMSEVGRRLYQAHFGRPELVTEEQVRELLRGAASEAEEHKFSQHFLWTEWSRVVDAWQLVSWEQYRDVPRLGRKTRLAEPQRAVLWSIFSIVSAALDERGLLTEPRLCSAVWNDDFRSWRIHRSSSAWSTRHRTSLWPNCGFWPPSVPRAPTRCSSPATLARGSFRHRSPGGRWGSTSGVAHRP